jgi:hypothetical protein
MKMALSKPITNGTWSYAYRNTGGAWSAETAMVGGVDSTINFVAPVCDELRITGTLAAAEAIDRFHICGLNFTGLTFDIAGSVAIATVAQAVYQRPLRTHRQTMRFASDTTDTPVVIITGINQRILNFRQLMFAKVGFVPQENFIYPSPIDAGNSYIDIQGGGSNHLKVDDRTKGDVLNFRENYDDDYLDMTHFVDHVLSRGYCLFERDSTSDDYKDSYIATVKTSRRVNPTNLNLNNFALTAKEAFEQ